MAHVSNINVHATERLDANAASRGGTAWLELAFSDDKGAFRVSAFMPYDRAQRVAEAINAAWPAPKADPVINWYRPPFHSPATAQRSARRCIDCGINAALDEGVCQRCRDYNEALVRELAGEPNGQVLR